MIQISKLKIEWNLTWEVLSAKNLLLKLWVGSEGQRYSSSQCPLPQELSLFMRAKGLPPGTSPLRKGRSLIDGCGSTLLGPCLMRDRHFYRHFVGQNLISQMLFGYIQTQTPHPVLTLYLILLLLLPKSIWSRALSLFCYKVLSTCASLVAQMVRNLPAIQETRVPSLSEDPLQKEMATHASIPAWRIPWTEEPGYMGSQRVRHGWVTNTHSHNIENTSQVMKKRE